MNEINVIGAGLAGSEAAWQLAERGVNVNLFEMREVKSTPVHKTNYFSELVCSNSLRSDLLTNAVGVLKAEMRLFNSLIMQCADKTSVPAGGALAVDRLAFSKLVTDRIKNHPNITVYNEEITVIPRNKVTIIATGPLTSEEFSAAIKTYLGEEYFYFYDAASPIVEKSTIDMSKVYLKSRYDRGTSDYLNCPFTEAEFNIFYEALLNAEVVPLKNFEKEIYFEGCMPIEVLAKRGPKTLLYSMLKPVGLNDPRTGKRPFAVVQLRQDNLASTLYNLVGFQTHLTWPEQRRVLRLIPGLENASFARYGVMHRNTFINSPKLLLPTYQLQKNKQIFFAGQITGVEGYVESAASGLVAGINGARLVKGELLRTFPVETTLGSLANYITAASTKYFQPMNANFGLLPPLTEKVKDKKERYTLIAKRALAAANSFYNQLLND